ncbi:MAG TPA: AraC family transcriptional regulator [Bacillales bacterium]|nr:AraC family transcriptional regulator [Bacillales bacterium]
MEMSLDLNHVGFNHFDLAANEADELHTHDCFQLSIPLNNSIQVYYNHQWRVIEPDEALLVAPGDFHQHEAVDTRSEILLVGVSEELLRQVIGDQLEESLDIIDFSPWQKGKMGSFFQTARRAFQTAAFEGMDQCSELEWELACLFLESQLGSHSHLLKRTSADDYPIVHRAIEFIQAHYQENLNLEILASSLNVSKYHLHRVFKQATGRTPTEYVHDVRMEKARWLIQSENMDITTIAFQVGYQSLSTFRRAFKKYYRLNPHEYRQLNQS